MFYRPIVFLISISFLSCSRQEVHKFRNVNYQFSIENELYLGYNVGPWAIGTSNDSVLSLPYGPNEIYKFNLNGVKYKSNNTPDLGVGTSLTAILEISLDSILYQFFPPTRNGNYDSTFILADRKGKIFSEISLKDLPVGSIQFNRKLELVFPKFRYGAFLSQINYDKKTQTVFIPLKKYFLRGTENILYQDSSLLYSVKLKGDTKRYNVKFLIDSNEMMINPWLEHHGCYSDNDQIFYSGFGKSVNITRVNTKNESYSSFNLSSILLNLEKLPILEDNYYKDDTFSTYLKMSYDKHSNCIYRLFKYVPDNYFFIITIKKKVSSIWLTDL